VLEDIKPAAGNGEPVSSGSPVLSFEDDDEEE